MEEKRKFWCEMDCEAESVESLKGSCKGETSFLDLLVSAASQTDEIIMITDADLERPGPRIVFVNPAFTRVTGYSATEAVGKSPRILQGPGTDRSLMRQLVSDLKKGEPFYGETTNYKKDGTPYAVEWHISPVRDTSGKITHFVSVQRDVSEKKTAEEDHRRLVALVESSDDAIISKDLEGNITSWNRGAHQIYGYNEKEVLGKSIRFIFPKDKMSEFDHIMQKMVAGDRLGHFETVRVRKDGAHINVSLSISPIIDHHDKIMGVSVIARDVTKQKMLEAELKRYTESLEQEVKVRTNELIQSEKMASIGLLVAGVAHEINNPLSYIKSNTELLKEMSQLLGTDKWDTGMRDELVRLIQVNSEGLTRIANITATLKRFARPDSGEWGMGDVNQGLKDTLILMSNKLKYRVKVEEDYGKVPQVRCNIGQLNQVFMNLLLNASEAMDTGNIWIRTWAEKNSLFISIRDNGSGMPHEIYSKIFDPFFTTKTKGTGLGLSISYKIIKTHKGDILVDSEVGKGTTMTIRLPLEE